MTLRDAGAHLRLQREIDREAARQGAGTIGQWEATLREVLWAARRHLGEHWEPFVAGWSRAPPYHPEKEKRTI